MANPIKSQFDKWRHNKNGVEMNKSAYLQTPIVNDFATYLANLIDNKIPFSHQYYWRGERKMVRFDSFTDAIKKYEWPFEYQNRISTASFNSASPQEIAQKGMANTGASQHYTVQKGLTIEDNQQCLAALSRGLKAAILRNDHQACQDYCLMILDWGGVLRKNKSKVEKLAKVLPEYLAACMALFNSPGLLCVGKYQVTVNGQCYDVVMNAGFTKIYSLICNDFIIYDGRVGGALGLLESNFYRHFGLAQDKHLSFHYGAAVGKQNRNPSTEDYKFSILSAGNPHIRDNIKANWLLTKVLEKQQSLQGDLAARLRDIECALFMIGYDLPLLGQKHDQSTSQATSDTSLGINKTKRVTAKEVREYAINFISAGLSKSAVVEFTSSDIKRAIGGDLTAICGALKKLDVFVQAGVALQVVDAPPKGLGKVTYRATHGL